MLDRPTADRTAFLLLWFFRQPSRYQTEVRRRDAPALDPEVILKLALGRSVEFDDPELGAPDAAATLKDAAAFYVRHVFFCPDATPYETLGLAPGASEAAIKESFRLLMQLVHPDRQEAQEQWPESFAAQGNRAYGILRNRDSREKFDREAQARAAGARAASRAAAASAPSTTPVVQRPRAGNRGSGPLSGAVLPEWLTAGVGGFAREHPAVVAFAVLIVGAGAIIGTTFREGREDSLIRDARENRVAAAPAVAKAAPVRADPAASVAGADETGAQGALRAKTRAPVAADVRGGADAPVAARSSVPGAASRTAPAGDSDSATPGRVPESVGVASGGAPSARVESASATAISSGASPPVLRSPAEPEKSVQLATVTPPARLAHQARTEPVAPTTMLPVAPQVRTEPVAPTAMPPVAPAVRPEPVALAAMPPVAPPRTEPVAPTAMPPAAPPVRIEPVAAAAMPPAPPSPPATAEIEALFAAFVESYERGRADAFAALFDDDADTNLRHGRAAIRGEYDELFRLSDWRRMQLTRVNWRRAGDRTYAKGEIAVRIAWRDGREVEQRLAVDMELVRRDGRVVIAKLSHQPKNP